MAGPLAAALGFPLRSKDRIKETLFDQLGHVADDEQRSSQRLGGTAMELLWTVAGTCPNVVLEANFRPQSSYERERLLLLTQRPAEVHCRVPIEVAERRFEQRAAMPSHHPVHIARAFPAEALREFKEPLGIGELIEVDTTGSVDLDSLATDVMLAFRS